MTTDAKIVPLSRGYEIRKRREKRPPGMHLSADDRGLVFEAFDDDGALVGEWFEPNLDTATNVLQACLHAVAQLRASRDAALSPPPPAQRLQTCEHKQFRAETSTSPRVCTSCSAELAPPIKKVTSRAKCGAAKKSPLGSGVRKMPPCVRSRGHDGSHRDSAGLEWT